MDIPTLDKIREAAQSLEPSERARLAMDLLESLEPQGGGSEDVERAWNAEAERRLAAFERGGIPTILAEDVHAESPES